MAGIFELNSFVHKFVNLWQAGRNASLKLDSQAGQASVTLQLDLGQQVPPSQHVRTTARNCRRQRRADARSATETGSVKDEDSKETTADTEEVEAFKGTDAAVEIIAGNVVEKTTKDEEKLWVDQRRYCIQRNSPFKLES